MHSTPFLIHALSPLHAGTGQSVDVIDLPIARMTSTGIPIVPGSSIKGVLRAARSTDREQDDVWAVFGPDTDNASAYAGAATFGDARLLALPVRSFRGTFAWVSSPLLLELARRDLAGVGDEVPEKVPEKVPAVEKGALSPEDSLNVHDGHIYLEDLDLKNGKDGRAIAETWAKYLAGKVSPDQEAMFRRRFVVVDDETMTFLWETATQIDTRIRIDPETGTVAQGALWIEESLPPETLLIGVFTSEPSKSDRAMSAEDVRDFVFEDLDVCQLGGSASIGRGRCRVLTL